MFTEITWATYLRVTAASLFIYYTLLFLKFYFPQIKASFPNGGIDIRPLKPHRNTEENPASTIMGDNGNLTPKGEFNQPGINDYEIIEEMVERVKGSLKEAATAGESEEVLTNNLKKIINDYPLLSKSTFRPSINEFIATESQLHGYAILTEDAIEQLWLKA
jgi:hypothetical protein